LGLPPYLIFRGGRALRRSRAHLRNGAFFFFNDWERYQRAGALLFARYDPSGYTLVALNTSDTELNVPFWFPIAGDYVEELHGGSLDLKGIPALQEVNVGIEEVKDKVDELRSKKNKSKLESYKEKHPEPVVKGLNQHCTSLITIISRAPSPTWRIPV